MQLSIQKPKINHQDVAVSSETMSLSTETCLHVSPLIKTMSQSWSNCKLQKSQNWGLNRKKPATVDLVRDAVERSALTFASNRISNCYRRSILIAATDSGRLEEMVTAVARKTTSTLTNWDERQREWVTCRQTTTKNYRTRRTGFISGSRNSSLPSHSHPGRLQQQTSWGQRARPTMWYGISDAVTGAWHVMPQKWTPRPEGLPLL